MKNLTIEKAAEAKSWDDLANIIFDLSLERQELKRELEKERRSSEYWYKEAQKWKQMVEDE